MGKNKLYKILGDLLDKLRKLYMNEAIIKKFLALVMLKKILGNFCFSEQIFYKNNRWVPLIVSGPQSEVIWYSDIGDQIIFDVNTFICSCQNWDFVFTQLKCL